MWTPATRRQHSRTVKRYQTDLTDAEWRVIAPQPKPKRDRQAAPVADARDGPVKAALVHLAKGLARQYARKKIRVNVVSPGTVYFKGGVWNTIEQNMPKRYEEALARNPTGRMATPQEIANAAVFLASPASSFTTGSNLVVDGAVSNRVNF